MPRKHLMIFPGTGVDFYRAERSYDAIWLRSGQASWLPNLLPVAYAAVSEADFSFSSFRELPMGDPSLMPLPPKASPYQVLILAPIGEPYPGQWGGLLFHSGNDVPCVAVDRFVPDNGGLRRVVQSFFTEEFIDAMRKPERERSELWVRHSLKIHDMLPDAYDSPRWLKEVRGLDAEAAARKIAALRLPMAAGQYESLRRQEREQREAQADAQAKTAEDAAFEERREAAEQVWKEAEAMAAAAVPSSSLQAPDETPPAPDFSRGPDRKTREKLHRATQSKLQADRKHEASARAFAEKRIRQMEAEGRL